MDKLKGIKHGFDAARKGESEDELKLYNKQFKEDIEQMRRIAGLSEGVVPQPTDTETSTMTIGPVIATTDAPVDEEVQEVPQGGNRLAAFQRMAQQQGLTVVQVPDDGTGNSVDTLAAVDKQGNMVGFWGNKGDPFIAGSAEEYTKHVNPAGSGPTKLPAGAQFKVNTGVKAGSYGDNANAPKGVNPGAQAEVAEMRRLAGLK